MRASTLALCLTLGLVAAGVADAGPKVLTRPTLVAGKVKEHGDGVVVGPGGAEWALPGGARVVAAPGAELRLIGKPQKLALGAKRNTPGYTVLLRGGEVRAVAVAERSAIVVAAPRQTRVLVVSGSLGVLAAEGHVAVANTDGEASVGVGSEPLRPLAPGMLRIVDRGAGAVRPLAVSPSRLEAPGVSFAFHDEPVDLGALAWPEALGAQRYRLELRDEAGRLVVRRETSELGLASGWSRVAPGAYSVRLSSLDPSGLEAAHPIERPLRVLGVTLPPGAFADGERAVHLPPGRRVELSHTEGVEVSYGTAQHFIAAPRALELGRPEPRLVRLRLAGSEASRNLFLVPREVRAKVEFGPRVPSWPKDPLEIRVRVEEAKGTPAADLVEARPKVMIGIDPVDVAFEKQGEWLIGTLLPRTGKGPWVVRVEVEDSNGSVLGRNFVEIAGR